MGLATVQKIARLYGGLAWMEETPCSSTFWVEMVDEPLHDTGSTGCNILLWEEKKPWKNPGLFFADNVQNLNSGYVGCLQAFRTFDDVERYPITFSKGFETIACYGGKLYEYILAVLLLKKTEPLAVIKPFYRAVYHVLTFS